MAESEQEVLTARLARYPADRYPVQHATTQFHLGSVLLHAGETGPALQALATAREHFGRAGLHLEQAKAMVMVGVGLRTAGRSAEAASAFAAACAELDTLDQPAEEAAACYNLGLVLRERGDTAGAHTAWTRAREQFLAAGLPSRAAAAARDHGASLLTSGSVDAALPLLERATALAEAAGDGPGTGLAANALGLAHLAAQDCPAAVSALDVALGVFSRAVRPAEHAMVKANLALAHEQAGDHQRARLAARQALAIPGAAAPVRAQAQQVLARLPGRADQDLLSVLDAADPQQRIPVLRDEVVRVVEVSPGERSAMLGGFFDGLLARPGASYDLAHCLLQVVLEQPPRAYGVLCSAVVDACAGRPEPDADRLRAVLASAMSRFALPQWQRLVATLNAEAEAAGEPATWR